MASIRDDELPSATGIPSAARRVTTNPPPAVEVTEELLRALPKTDLHCHLDGSLRLETILELAEQQKVQAARRRPRTAWPRRSTPARTASSLDEYLKAFDITLSVLQTEEALYRAAYELAEDARARERALHGGALLADAAHAAAA